MTAMRKIMGGLAVAVAAVTITFVVQSPAHATTARSSVLDVTLPDSTFTLFHTDNSANYKHEVWRSPSTSVSTAAVALRAQLPVGASLDGIPWCMSTSRPVLGERYAMFWVSTAKDQPAAEVEVEKDNEITGYVYLDITHWPSSHGDDCSDRLTLENR